MKTGLNIVAEDAADLEIISAQLQDALARLKDLVYLPKTRRFVAVFNRFKWEDAERFVGRNLRVRTGLHFDNVLSVKAHNLKLDNPAAIVSLLAVRFTANGPEDCAGTVELMFSGGGAMKLDVECLDAGLADISGPWAAQARPQHPLDEA
ncbi:MAG TPA: DUF2948 family protein [Rhizomicrobium sp.]|nr:DUF2948 family protein [Rhizomicrobium sp.]